MPHVSGVDIERELYARGRYSEPYDLGKKRRGISQERLPQDYSVVCGILIRRLGYILRSPSSGVVSGLRCPAHYGAGVDITYSRVSCAPEFLICGAAASGFTS